MKRKRVLALFLVLSIVFSSNGITALAAGENLNEPAVLVNDESTDTTEIEAEEESTVSDEAVETDYDFSEEAEEETDAEKTDETVTDAKEADETATDEAENGEESESESAEEETEIGVPVSRMLSFTDVTGMTVTYDANVEYEYTISEEGVLTEIKIKTGTEEPGDPVSGVVVIEEGKGITAIGETAFSGNTGITYVKLPTGVTTIDQNAFKGCTALTGITIPSGVTTIGDSAFEGCSKLIQLAIPKTLTSIGNRAFYDDSSLFMVYMRDVSYGELKTIGEYAFYGCKALTGFCSDTEFIFTSGLETIGVSAFEECRSIKKIVLPDSVTAIGSRAFYGCIALTDVTFSKGMDTIPEYAFYGCRNLSSVVFVSGNKVISGYAFASCSGLVAVNLIYSIKEVKARAFDGCAGLKNVTVRNPEMVLETSAFPNREDLYLIGEPESTAEEYADSCLVKFMELGTARFFKYTIDESIKGKITGVYLASDHTKEANSENNEQGVVAGTELVVAINTSGLAAVRFNGTPIQKNAQGDYVFKMPVGGAVISAEYEDTIPSELNIQQSDVIYKFSNGEELPNGNGIEIKKGQSARLFLIDSLNDNSVIPYANIDLKSNNPTIATISKDGMIKALKNGEAVITVTVKSRNSSSTTTLFTKTLYVDVVDADIKSLKVRLTSSKGVIDNSQAMPVISINRTAFSSDSALNVQASVTAYDVSGDDVAVALKWSSSDTKVGKPVAASTTDANLSNTISVPANASGEAIITVTATNADKSTATGKFIIRVVDTTPLLTAASITVNPNETQGAKLQVVVAEGTTINEKTKVEINDDFYVKYNEQESTSSIAVFNVQLAHIGVAETAHSVTVKIEHDNIEYKPIPLKITVKSSIPNPKVAFDKKQEKINLFYANDGTKIVPVITNLGDAEVEEYSLAALEQPAGAKDNLDNELFLKNFEVDPQSGVITQKSAKMENTSKNKPAVTGYLVLKFKGYKEGVNSKKYKITIPTQTVKPSYQLDKTSGTFYSLNTNMVAIKLIDKKTKEQIILNEADYTVIPEADSDFGNISINGKGEIELRIPTGSRNGKLKFSVKHHKWASAFTYTYTVKISNAAPTIKLKSATVNLNPNYPDQAADFILTSNQVDTKLVVGDETAFIASAKESIGKEEDYKKLKITYGEDGNGKVILDPSIKEGTYTYVAELKGNFDSGNLPLNKVTLKVKVKKNDPTVSAKGSLSLNLRVMQEEATELALTYKNLPENYELNEPSTLASIRCTTKDYNNFEKKFSWEFVDNKLTIRLLEAVKTQTYSFEMKPEFSVGDGSIPNVAAKKISFKIKVYNGEISVKLSAKGKLNLLDRNSVEFTQKNSIIYTPSLTNLKDTVTDAKIYDADRYVSFEDEESLRFDIDVQDGKIYVTPKPGAAIENNTNYKVKIWVGVKNCTNGLNHGGLFYEKILTIKTAQTLPKLTTDKTALSLYTSYKDYEATFTVTPKDGSIGKIEKIVFDEEDERSLDSFDLSCKPQADGSLIVTMKLKTAAYPCNTANKIKMYVIFEGQGVNTQGTAITMNVNIISKN